MRKLTVAVVVVAVLLGAMLLMSMAQNEGCLPWKEPVSTGGGPFSEGNRGETFCR